MISSLNRHYITIINCSLLHYFQWHHFWVVFSTFPWHHLFRASSALDITLPVHDFMLDWLQTLTGFLVFVACLLSFYFLSLTCTDQYFVSAVPWRICNCCGFFLVFEILNFRQINSTQLKSVFWRYKFGINDCNKSNNINTTPIIIVLACAHQRKKYAYRMKQTIFNWFHTSYQS